MGSEGVDGEGLVTTPVRMSNIEHIFPYSNTEFLPGFPDLVRQCTVRVSVCVVTRTPHPRLNLRKGAGNTSLFQDSGN